MMAAEQAPNVLSIGMIIGGRTPANRPWIEAIQGLMNDVKVARTNTTSKLNLNVEFQVPGNHLKPDFEGVRTGAFRRDESLLKVQVAIPPRASADPRRELIDLLDAAIDAADVWAVAKRRTFDTSSLRALVASLEP